MLPRIHLVVWLVGGGLPLDSGSNLIQYCSLPRVTWPNYAGSLINAMN